MTQATWPSLLEDWEQGSSKRVDVAAMNQIFGGHRWRTPWSARESLDLHSLQTRVSSQRGGLEKLSFPCVSRCARSESEIWPQHDLHCIPYAHLISRGRGIQVDSLVMSGRVTPHSICLDKRHCVIKTHPAQPFDKTYVLGQKFKMQMLVGVVHAEGWEGGIYSGPCLLACGCVFFVCPLTSASSVCVCPFV